MSTRIYKVVITGSEGQDEAVRLVRAGTASQAVRFVAEPMIVATIPTPEELHEFGTKGTKIEEAKED